MSKKKRKNKRVLGKKSPAKKPQDKPVVVDVRSDLRKAAALTAFCLGILAILFLTKSRWSP